MTIRWDDKGGYLSTRGLACAITIETRPPYCDRGNYLAKLWPEGHLAGEIDTADSWPRYYFDLEIAKAECEAWLRKRGQLVEAPPIVFHAHTGICPHCGGPVKISRDAADALDPEHCYCLGCGAMYRVDVGESIEAWEAEQWRQKAESQ